MMEVVENVFTLTIRVLTQTAEFFFLICLRIVYLLILSFWLYRQSNLALKTTCSDFQTVYPDATDSLSSLGALAKTQDH